MDIEREEFLRDDVGVGLDIADYTGLSVTSVLGEGGCDGHVYELSDGRVMKVSFSENDAMVAQDLMEHPDAMLPVIYNVNLYKDSRDLNVPIFVIIREELSDIEEFRQWKQSSNMPRSHIDNELKKILGHSIYKQEGEVIFDNQHFKHELEMLPEYIRPVVSDIFTAIQNLYNHTGFLTIDLHYDNFGRSQDGTIKVRDWGMGHYKNEKSLDVDTIPYIEQASTLKM